MAIHLEAQKLLFIMVPGTGCSVVGKAMRQQLRGLWLPETDVYENGRKVMSRKHHDVEQLIRYGILSLDQRNEIQVFATIRNPFDRLATYWQRMAGGWNSESFGVRRRELRRQIEQLGEREVAHRLDDLGRQERAARRRAFLAKAVGFNLWLRRTIHQFERQDSLATDPDAARFERLFPLTNGVDSLIRYERLADGVHQMLRSAGCNIELDIPQANRTPGKRPFNSYWNSFSVRLMNKCYGPILDRVGYSVDGVVGESAALLEGGLS